MRIPGSSKRVLITGASAGLGVAVARELARRGHHLALTARRGERIDALADEFRALGVTAVALVDDLADPDMPARVIPEAVRELGGLDVLINNAGYGLPLLFAQCDPDDLRRQIAVNLTAPLLLTRWAIPHLVESKGMVINVGSAVTSVANPVFGAYGATKAALAYWNDALRRELRDAGVRVCLVEPGPVDTEFFVAVRRLAGPGRALGIDATPDSLYNPLRDRPPQFMTASVEDAARRIADLLERPKRRLSFLRRMVWPWRVVGGVFQIWPWYGDWAVCWLLRRIDRPELARRSEAVAEEVGGRRVE